MKNDIVISLKDVTKKYVLHHEKPTFIENVVMRKRKEIFWAIDGVSLSISKGERVGIIGPNGSGKTTLLKLISQITVPTSGKIRTKGRIISLIDLDAGFHPDLTGEENILLNGMILGLSREGVVKNYKKIIDFADIGKFISSPLYTYSSGMRLRLGFSVAIYSDPDILVLDENISVGDEQFKKKLNNKLNDLMRKGKTVISVSHYKPYLERICSRYILIKNGKIVMDGGKEVLDDYFGC